MTKADIINLIKEIAAKNSGVAPGMKHFASETGVSVHAWRGRYWLRWSEALAEAGFAPNKWSEAYGDDFLLEKLATLTRKNKHFPTYGEMLFARRADPSVPGVEAINRLGPKATRVALLRDFCGRHPTYADVLAFLPADVEGDDGEDAEPAASDEMEGFVYMVRLRKHYKIGRTTAVPRRHREIALQLPEEPSLVHYIRTDDPEGIERYWHTRFAAFRANGEWFALSPKEIRAFKRRKFM